MLLSNAINTIDRAKFADYIQQTCCYSGHFQCIVLLPTADVKCVCHHALTLGNFHLEAMRSRSTWAQMTEAAQTISGHHRERIHGEFCLLAKGVQTCKIGEASSTGSVIYTPSLFKTVRTDLQLVKLCRKLSVVNEAGTSAS